MLAAAPVGARIDVEYFHRQASLHNRRPLRDAAQEDDSEKPRSSSRPRLHSH